MGDVVYRSEVTVVRDRGPLRRAFVPAREEPLHFGVHGAIADSYGVSTEDFGETTTTLDYVVAAAAG